MELFSFHIFGIFKMVTFMVIHKKVIIWGVRASFGPAFMPNADWEEIESTE